MSVKKCINDNFDVVYRGLEMIAKENHDLLAAFANKLEETRKSSRFAWLISFRNWLTFVLLCAILFLMLVSCNSNNPHVSTLSSDSVCDTSYLLIRGKNVYFYPSDGIQQHWDSVYYLKVN